MKPISTISAGCKTYVFFSVDSSRPDFKVIIERLHDHNGHDPSDLTDLHCSTVTPELVKFTNGSLLVSFMVDKDYEEINALHKTFPGTKILLCWFHVRQVFSPH
ncbi:hypothetical protein AOXY_G3666 [Acipenser oxyrinchus oxyrinchus]|uniref:MULE transposase domain-containing protein n=1 Tax=Acipenser oxyrinchus oxyrinchus TaxID=40147 RepID=A0AAD8GFZ5_ACIOX|nr:hypothetical protein AOXY_G3666 [Acipenser oxyrinchus oxyrinchus]